MPKTALAEDALAEHGPPNTPNTRHTILKNVIARQIILKMQDKTPTIQDKLWKNGKGTHNLTEWLPQNTTKVYAKTNSISAYGCLSFYDTERAFQR